MFARILDKDGVRIANSFFTRWVQADGLCKVE